MRPAASIPGRTWYYWGLMKLLDVAKPDSKFFLKSVYAPVDESWPAMSYTLPALKTYLAGVY